MSRPQIVANGGSPGVKASVIAGDSVELTLDSIVGIRSVQWIVISTDETTTIADYPITQSGPVGQNATFSVLTPGTALLVKVIVNSGLVRGSPNLNETSNTIKIFVPTDAGHEVGCAGETYESDSTQGTTALLNAPIRALGGFAVALPQNDLKRALVVKTTNVAITGDPSPVDGVTVLTGDVVLLIGQTNPVQNGLWSVNTFGAWSRPTNFLTGAAAWGSVIVVIAGTVSAGRIYQNSNATIPTVGVTGLTFVRLPDRADRVDLSEATYNPTIEKLVRYTPNAGLIAQYFQTAQSPSPVNGLLRAADGETIISAIADDGTTEVSVLGWGVSAADELDIASTFAQSINLSIGATKDVRMVDDGLPHRVYRCKKVSTFDVGPFDSLQFALATNMVVLVEANAMYLTVTGDAGGFRLTATVKRLVGGALLVGIVNKLAMEDNVVTDADADVVVSGNNLIVQVFGVAATNVSWTVSACMSIHYNPSS